MEQSVMQKIVAMLRGGGNQGQQMANPAYTQYAREAQAMGQPVLNPQQWAMQAQQQVATPAFNPAAQVQEEPKPFRF